MLWHVAQQLSGAVTPPQDLSVTDTGAVLLGSWVTSDASRRGLPASHDLVVKYKTKVNLVPEHSLSPAGCFTAYTLRALGKTNRRFGDLGDLSRALCLCHFRPSLWDRSPLTLRLNPLGHGSCSDVCSGLHRRKSTSRSLRFSTGTSQEPTQPTREGLEYRAFHCGTEPECFRV